MIVPFVDLKARYQHEATELKNCFDRVLESGQLILSKHVEDLEQHVCSYTGSKYCISLNSGTDALMIGLWASGIGKGDEVIVPAISFFATVGAVTHVGATPVFCDVSDDLNIDTEKVETLISERTKAVMPVHWTGKTANLARLKQICAKHDLLLFEDSAQSMGGTYKGTHPGILGHFGAISCHPLKNFNAVGDAGLLLTQSKELNDKALKYRNHGMVERDKAEIFGVNSRLDAVHAEILKFRLGKLNEVIEKRTKNVRLYKQLLDLEEICLPPDSADGDVDTHVMFIIRAQYRDQLRHFLMKKGIETIIYYGTPLHKHPACEVLKSADVQLPRAEQICKEVLALPHHQYITKEQIQYVSKSVKEFYTQNRRS